MIINPHQTNYNLKYSSFYHNLSTSTNAEFQKWAYIWKLWIHGLISISLNNACLFLLVSIFELVSLIKSSQQIVVPFIRCRQTTESQRCCAGSCEFPVMPIEALKYLEYLLYYVYFPYTTFQTCLLQMTIINQKVQIAYI